MGAITYHVHCRILGSIVTLLLHGGNSLEMFFAMRGDILKDPDIANLQASQFKYFTIWNVAFQIVYSAINLTCDIPLVLRVEEESSNVLCNLKYLRKYRQIFFGAVIFPTGVAVFTVFWPFYLYDRELIFPKYIDKALSHTSNQIMHTAILPIVLWELLFQPRSKPNSHVCHLGHMAAIYFSYLFVLFTTYAEKGTWPYPIFYYLYGTIYFPMLIIAFGVLYVMLYFVQWPLTAFIHNGDSKIKSKKLKK